MKASTEAKEPYDFYANDLFYCILDRQRKRAVVEHCHAYWKG